LLRLFYFSQVQGEFQPLPVGSGSATADISESCRSRVSPSLASHPGQCIFIWERARSGHARAQPDRLEHLESRGSVDCVHPHAVDGAPRIAILFQGHVLSYSSSLLPKEIVGRGTVCSESSRAAL